MKRIILLLFSVSLSLTLHAQRADLLINQIMSDGTISINLDDPAKRALSRYARPEKVLGYRVCIFSDNSQGARSAANNTLGMLHSVSPSTRGEMIYTNPFFKVYAGACLTKAEASVLLGRLKSSFPRAFIAPMQLSPQNFIRSLNIDTSIQSDDSLESDTNIIKE